MALSADQLAELKKLAELRELGVLSDAEAEAEKARIMDGEGAGGSSGSTNLYVPGSHSTAPRDSSMPAPRQLRAVSPRAPWTVKRVAVTIIRIYLCVITLGTSEVVIFAIKKRRASQVSESPGVPVEDLR